MFINRTEEYMADMEQVPVYIRRESEVPKLLALIKKGGGSQGIERPLGQLLRLIGKTQIFDYQCFWLMDGLGAVAKVIQNVSSATNEISRRFKTCIRCNIGNLINDLYPFIGLLFCLYKYTEIHVHSVHKLLVMLY